MHFSSNSTTVNSRNEECFDQLIRGNRVDERWTTWIAVKKRVTSE